MVMKMRKMIKVTRPILNSPGLSDEPFDDEAGNDAPCSPDPAGLLLSVVTLLPLLIFSDRKLADYATVNPAQPGNRRWLRSY